jgi:hypothetical protein
MAFDLGLAMRKKEEFESARWMDFEFRRRARATRLLAEALGLNQAVSAKLIATSKEDEIPQRLAALTSVSVDEVWSEYRKYLTIAHDQLVRERGDPAPYRMA